MLRPSVSAGRLTRNNRTKYKVLELLPRATTPAGSWGAAFANFSHADFDARIAYAKSLGANACKIACSGITSGGVDNNFPIQPKFEAIVQDYCQLLRKYGMKHYHQISNGPTDFTGTDGSKVAVQVAQMAANYAIWVKHGADLIIGVDVCNEVNFNRPTTWPAIDAANAATNVQMENDLGVLLAAIRSVAPYIPASFSVYMGTPVATSFAQPSLKLQATLGCDYHDYHSYDGYNTDYTVTVANCPKGGDLTTLEAQSWFIGRHFNSECGIPGTNGLDAQQAWLQGMKEQAMRPASHGGVYFGDIDFGPAGAPGSSNGQDYGMAGHPVIIGGFAGWPAQPAVAATG